MSYGSKTISTKIAAAREIASRAFTVGPAVAAALEEGLRSALDPAEPSLPDLRQLQTLIGRKVETMARKMAELHEHHHHSRALERHEAAKVRAAAGALRDHLREVRFVLDRHFGCRQGVANFEGRHDLLRLPMHSLERICIGLLRVMEDEKFGWSASAYRETADGVREKLSSLLAAYQAAQAAAAEVRGQRAHAAAERERGIAKCEQEIARMTILLRRMCSSAGFDSVARSLRRRPADRRKKAKKAKTGPVPAAE